MSFELKALKDICTIQIGKTPSRHESDYWRDGTHAWLSIADMNQGRYLNNTKEYITDLGVKASNIKLIPKNTLVLSYKLSIGKVGITQKPMYTNEAIASLTELDSQVDINYLYWALQHIDLLENADRAAMGKTLNKAKLSEVKIPLPPLEEQRRIASILDQADELRQKRQQAIEKLDQLLQATFIDMFGDPVSNPKGWDKLTIEKMLNNEKYSLKRGPFGGALKKEIFVESGYLVYEQYHALNNDFSFQRYFIDEDKYKELKAFNVKPKDIIVSCSGVNLGRLAEVPEGSPAGIINQALLKISLNQSIILNDIFIDIFMHPSFKKAFYGDFRGAAIPNFPPMSVFKEFEFIVPPLEIQKKYQSVKSQVKALQKNHQLADEMNLFSSLQNQAFNGTL
ncbi:restriction endonuclease subunit S [Acinetobacter haemolyticus]|uniref:restriction endonuclease subunit S n=1 Tax=Acinetobacter haemolyticus TaxID=29430 RepID=UPI001331C8F4|nr:restriction endonuclease subunit S [Acinetobacter haemolyticus]QHI29988.1 restriction endonuclease subunit S [Acinetobacter haemolyticus]